MTVAATPLAVDSRDAVRAHRAQMGPRLVSA